MNFLIILLFIFCVAAYFLPTLVSFTNKKENKSTVFLVNLLVGWSVIGWLIALYLAVRRDKIVIQNV